MLIKKRSLIVCGQHLKMASGQSADVCFFNADVCVGFMKF